MPATDTPQSDPLAPCGYCRRCAIHDDPGGCLTVERYVRQQEGEKVARLLDKLPVGAEFKLAGVSLAYCATYRKNAAHLWDQIAAPEAPLVTNFDPAHLGFCVGFEPVAAAVAGR